MTIFTWLDSTERWWNRQCLRHQFRANAVELQSQMTAIRQAINASAAQIRAAKREHEQLLRRQHQVLHEINALDYRIVQRGCVRKQHRYYPNGTTPTQKRLVPTFLLKAKAAA